MEFAIDASALHPTTELGLEAILYLQDHKNIRKILDIGCGNGLLSIVATQVWDANVLAVDISENAVADTLTNVKEQDLSERISVVRSDRFAHPLIQKTGPYDLIIGNLLAEWLTEMAMDIKNNLNSGGYVILCGMLEWLAADTELSFSRLGFEIIEQIKLPPWQCSVLKHIS